MTVDPLLSWETDSLLKPERKFFPSHIPVHHHQLRHIISSPCTDVVYFASAEGLFCVNTATRKRSRVGHLPFVPKCSATGYGWYCAGGGRSGDFVAIYIPHGSTGSRRSSRQEAASAADRAWAERWPNEPLFDYQLRLTIQEQGANSRVKKLGSDIVNSISIHRIQSSREGDLDDVVAILTNNDKTVRVYSLSQDAELSVLELPFAVNHASLSPDQKTIVAVGDKEAIYFYRRIDTGHSATSRSGTPQYPRYHWASWTHLPLHKPKGEMSSAYFSTAWSPNGRLCATASEEGYISVLDMDKLEGGHEDDAVIAIIPSTRPQVPTSGMFSGGPPGAVRTMTFSKEPWDLLFWTEGSGRLCVGDVRNGLKSRQIIQLESDAEGVTKIDFMETSSSPSSFDDVASGYHHRSSLHGSRANASPPALDQVSLPGLSRQEQNILNNLRTARQHVEALREGTSSSLNDRRPTPLSINYISGNVRSGSSTPASDYQTTPVRPPSSRLAQDTLAWQTRSRNESSRGTRWPEPLSRYAPSFRPPWLYGPVGSGSSEPPRPTLYPGAPMEGTDPATGGVHPHPPTSTAEDWSSDADREAWRVVQEHLLDQQMNMPTIRAANEATSGTFLEDLPAPDHPPLPRYRTSTMRDRERDRDREREERDRDREREREQLRERARERDEATRFYVARDLPQGGPPLGFPMRYADFSSAQRARLRERWHDETRDDVSVDADPRYGPLTTGIALDDDGETVYVGTDQGIFRMKINAKARMTWGSIVPR